MIFPYVDPANSEIKRRRKRLKSLKHPVEIEWKWWKISLIRDETCRFPWEIKRKKCVMCLSSFEEGQRNEKCFSCCFMYSELRKSWKRKREDYSSSLVAASLSLIHWNGAFITSPSSFELGLISLENFRSHQFVVRFDKGYME